MRAAIETTDKNTTGEDTQKVISRFGHLRLKYKPLMAHLKRFGKRVPIHYVLIVALVIAAYYIGSLRTEVAYLKAGSGKVAVAATPAGGQSASNPVAAQPSGPVPEVTDRDHIRGARDAPVVLVEYSDFECPFCKRFHPTMQQILLEYGSKVAWVYRHYPLDFHANAQKEAEAAECVGELGGNQKFWEYTDKIFERTQSNGTGLALTALAPLAGELGLDQTKFKQCLDSGRYTQHVKDEFAAGQAAGIRGTPGTFVLAKGKAVDTIHGALPLDQVKQRVDVALSQ